MNKKADSYIIQCRTNFFLGIRPADLTVRDTEGNKALVKIAKKYFEDNLYDDFACTFIEGQYLISLWTAHLILEYGQPDLRLKELCIKTIEDHTNNPLAQEVAIEEKAWLDNYHSNRL